VVEAASYSREAGREACAELFQSLPGLTAIAAGNDLVAMGCYDYLREHGIRCPDDVSVVGHNDMPFVDALTPPLTTIRIAVHEMGEQAATLLLGRSASPRRQWYPFRRRPNSSCVLDGRRARRLRPASAHHQSELPLNCTES
jgi:DNA-binding LacI/PurR family transcriptional regulator